MKSQSSVKAVCLLIAILFSQIGQLVSYSNHDLSLLVKSKDRQALPLFIQENNGDIIHFKLNSTLFYFQKDAKAKKSSLLITTNGELSNTELANFLCLKNRELEFSYALEFATAYITECAREGLNHDIAFAQMCLETGFLKYGGSVHPSQNNYCGLGAVSSNVSGDVFSSEMEGIIAHVQHLKAYANKKKLNSPLVDKRFKYVKRGSVKTIYDLSGRWAMDPLYGKKIHQLLDRMYAI